jgi:hypothetical protein
MNMSYVKGEETKLYLGEQLGEGKGKKIRGNNNRRFARKDK